MRRDPALRRLSSDHHTGLVTARRARELAAGDASGRAAGWADLQERFANELEPHFRLEEQGLLPALQMAGESVLVERTLADHRRLRALIASQDARTLVDFAQALTEHIRFEEAELFETAQTVLPRETLAALEAFHGRGPAPVCRNPTR